MSPPSSLVPPLQRVARLVSNVRARREHRNDMGAVPQTPLVTPPGRGLQFVRTKRRARMKEPPATEDRKETVMRMTTTMHAIHRRITTAALAALLGLGLPC